MTSISFGASSNWTVSSVAELTSISFGASSNWTVFSAAGVTSFSFGASSNWSVSTAADVTSFSFGASSDWGVFSAADLTSSSFGSSPNRTVLLAADVTSFSFGAVIGLLFMPECLKIHIIRLLWCLQVIHFYVYFLVARFRFLLVRWSVGKRSFHSCSTLVLTGQFSGRRCYGGVSLGISSQKTLYLVTLVLGKL